MHDRYDPAIQWYGRITERPHTNSFFNALLKIGDLYLAKGNREQAVEAYQRLLHCAGGSYWGIGNAVAQAAHTLEELGVPLPTHTGYDPKAVLTQGAWCIRLGEKGYRRETLKCFPLQTVPEALAPFQIVVMQWPKGGQPWWVTQSWLNFVRRGGGLALLMSRYLRRSAAAPIRASLGINPTPDARTATWGWRTLTGGQQHPAAQAIDNMLVLCLSPFQADQGIVLATWHDFPMLAAVERGLGRVLVAGFPLSPIGREYAQSHMDAAERDTGKTSPLPRISYYPPLIGCARRKLRGKEANS